MGSKTKSWLALALAIVMVLGMGIPAYAAPTTGGTPIVFTNSSGTQVGTGTAYGTAYELTMGNGAQTVNLLDTSTSGEKLTNLYLGQTPKVTVSTNITGANPSSYIPYVDVAISNGVMTLTPKAQTPGTTSVLFKVKVESSNDDGSWSPTDSSLADDFETNGYYEAVFNFRVRSALVATPSKVELDINSSWANNVGTYTLTAGEEEITNVVLDSITRTTGDSAIFTSTTAGYLAGTAANGLLAIGGTSGTTGTGRVLTVTAPTNTARTGSGVIRLRATVNDSFAYVDIPYVIGYTALTTSAHHIELNPETLTLRTDGVSGTIITKVVDKNGVIPVPAYSVSNLSLLNPTSGTNVVDATVAKATLNTTTGDIVVTPKAAGTTTFTILATGGVQPKTFTVTVSNMTVTATPNPVTVDVNEYSIAAGNGLDEAVITFSPVGTGTVDASSASIASTYPTGRFTVLSREGLNTNQIKVKATSAQVTAGAGVGTITFTGIKLNNQAAESVTVDFVVSDTTDRPKIFAKRNDGTLIGDTITMDRQNGDVSQEIVFTPSGKKITGLSYTVTQETGALAPITTFAPGSFSITSADSATLKLTNTTGALGTATLKISGFVDGVKITPYTITVNVINSNLSTINKLAANKTSIAQAVTANTFTITAWAENYFGTRIAIDDATRGIASGDNNTNNNARWRLEASVEYDTGSKPGLAITQPTYNNAATTAGGVGREDGVFNFSTSEPCKGKIVIELRKSYRPTGGAQAAANDSIRANLGTGNSAHAIPVLEIPFVIGDVMIQGSMDEVILDLKDDDSKTTEFTITPVDTGATLTESEITFTPMIGAIGNIVRVKKAASAEGVYTISTGASAAAGQWGYLTITGKVNGKAATAVKQYRYEIKNSRGLKANKDLFEFNLSTVNGVQQENLVITPVPSTEALTITSVKADVDTFVTLTNTANATSSSTWLIKAKAPGTGTITINGKVNNVAVDPITVTYNVVQAAQVVTATPATVALDIKTDSTTKAQTVTFAGPLTTDVVAITSITSSNTAVATVSSTSPYVITGVSVGTANVTAKVTLNGVAVADVVIPVTVTDSTTTIEGYKMNVDGQDIVTDKDNVIGIGNEAKFSGVTGLLTGNTYRVKSMTSFRSGKVSQRGVEVSTAKPKGSLYSNKIAAVDIRDGMLYYMAKGVGFWAVDLKLENGETVTFSFENVDGTATSVTVPEIGTLHVGERFDLRGAIEVTPAGANKNKMTYKYSKNGVVAVTTTGILKAQKVGTANIQILSKKGGKVLKTISVTVDNNYDGINFLSAYLFQDKNTDKANVVKILGDAKFGANTITETPYDVTETSSVALKNKLKGMASALKATGVIDRDDIFTFYYSGETTTAGIKFAEGDVLTFDELAVLGGEMPCQVFMVFDCSYSGNFISKGSIQNSLYKAVAKQNAAYAKTVGAAGNGKAKIHVLLATEKVDEKITALGTEGGTRKLTEAFVKTLSRGTDGKLGNGALQITMNDLYKTVKKTATTAGLYPQMKNGGDEYVIYKVQELVTTPAAE